MTVRLNITMNEDLYRRLKRELPAKRISWFIEQSVRSCLRPDRKLSTRRTPPRRRSRGAMNSRTTGTSQTRRAGRSDQAKHSTCPAQSASRRGLVGGARSGSGTEIKKTRPAVVVSNDSCNTHGSRVVVVPVTSNVDSIYPGEARIRVGGSPARALGDQIRSIDKRRIVSRVCVLTDAELDAVDEALKITLEL